MTSSIQEFIDTLSSKAPVPGGGGASALIGAVSSSLCSMVANLTSGKKKYADFQNDIDQILKETEVSTKNLLVLIQKDAEAFEPLSKAYGIPKDMPERDDILEKALVTAGTVPLEILKESAKLVAILEQLSVKGSRLALSDVGVAASACRSAMEGAAMNVYCNTRLMKNREYAITMNTETDSILQSGIARCDKIYNKITNELRS